MLTADEKLTKVSDDRRKASVYLRSDLKDHAMARDELTSMDAGNKAVATAVDLKVPDPRISMGPSVVPLNTKGEPMVDFQNEKLGGYCAVYEIQARLI